MYRYEDCHKCGAVDGERLFSFHQIEPIGFFCEECRKIMQARWEMARKEVAEIKLRFLNGKL